jgi:hypothetical protein
VPPAGRERRTRAGRIRGPSPTNGSNRVIATVDSSSVRVWPSRSWGRSWSRVKQAGPLAPRHLAGVEGGKLTDTGGRPPHDDLTAAVSPSETFATGRFSASTSSALVVEVVTQQGGQGRRKRGPAVVSDPPLRPGHSGEPGPLPASPTRCGRAGPCACRPASRISSTEEREAASPLPRSHESEPCRPRNAATTCTRTQDDTASANPSSIAPAPRPASIDAGPPTPGRISGATTGDLTHRPC